MGYRGPSRIPKPAQSTDRQSKGLSWTQSIQTTRAQSTDKTSIHPTPAQRTDRQNKGLSWTQSIHTTRVVDRQTKQGDNEDPVNSHDASSIDRETNQWAIVDPVNSHDASSVDRHRQTKHELSTIQLSV